MPHQNIPEGWVDTVIGAIATAIASVLTWLAKHFLGRVAKVEERQEKAEGRVATLERLAALHDERHQENLRRLDRIERSTDSIDGKLDRLLMERDS